MNASHFGCSSKGQHKRDQLHQLDQLSVSKSSWRSVSWLLFVRHESLEDGKTAGVGLGVYFCHSVLVLFVLKTCFRSWRENTWPNTKAISCSSCQGSWAREENLRWGQNWHPPNQIRLHSLVTQFGSCQYFACSCTCCLWGFFSRFIPFTLSSPTQYIVKAGVVFPLNCDSVFPWKTPTHQNSGCNNDPCYEWLFTFMSWW